MAKRTVKDLVDAQAEQRRARMRRAYAQRDDLLVALSKLLPAHLMPTKRQAVAGEAQDWVWSLCIHGAEQMVWPLDNRLAARFGHLPRSTANHWDGHDHRGRSTRLEALAQTCTISEEDY